MLAALAIVLSYAFACVLFGPLVARRKGVDLRAVGSGNPGATNVQRALGKKAAALVFVLDASKGALAVLGTYALVRGSHREVFVPAISGLAAVLGHCFPLPRPSLGGKGVSTALGALGLLAPLSFVVAVATYAITRALSGYGSVGSLTAVSAAAVVACLHVDDGCARLAILAILLLVVVRHRENLRRLSRGEELS